MLFLFGILSQCSCIQLLQKYFYNSMLPGRVLDRIDHYFDLDDAQRNFLELEIAKIHKWHRHSQLPAYAKEIFSLQKRLDSGIEKTDLRWLSERFLYYRNHLFRKVIPMSAQFLHTLRSSQLENMKRRLDEENRELSEELKRDKKSRYESQAERILDQFEYFTGDFDDQQERELIRHISSLPDTLPFWLRYRAGQQLEFYRFMQSKPQIPAIEAHLDKIMVLQEKNIPSHFRKEFVLAMEKMQNVLLKVMNILTAEQKRRFNLRLDDIRKLLLELSA